MADFKITCRPNGPLLIEGRPELIDSAGNPIAVAPEKLTFSLCRCGLSERKPFCDGAHGRKGWQENPAPPVVELK